MSQSRRVGDKRSFSKSARLLDMVRRVELVFRAPANMLDDVLVGTCRTSHFYEV